MRPLLLIDAYVEDDARPTWAPYLTGGGRPLQIVRVARGEALPTDPTAYAAVVQTGSAACLPDGVDWAPGVLRFLSDVVARDVPYLGVCWGHQLLAAAVGDASAVRKMARPEVGVLPVTVHDPGDALLSALPPQFPVMISHEDEVAAPVPAGLEIVASSEACPVHALRVPGQRQWGVQFHAEMPRHEVEALLHRRSRRHPELGLDVPAALAAWEAAPRLAPRLFGRFLALVDQWGESAGR